jgi:CheY-like chemotaxis protein
MPGEIQAVALLPVKIVLLIPPTVHEYVSGSPYTSDAVATRFAAVTTGWGDIVMPEITGAALLTVLRSREPTADPPWVSVTVTVAVPAET